MPDKDKGLSKAKEIYSNRPQRVKELKAAGKKIIGYPCLARFVLSCHAQLSGLRPEEQE
jgi:hypothetical protein